MPPNGRGHFSSNSSHSKYNIPRLATDVSVYGYLLVEARWKLTRSLSLSSQSANFHGGTWLIAINSFIM